MLTGLGSYWKGRKPLVLNKACILASLLPKTNDSVEDLEVFELLMAMDDTSIQKRLEANLSKSKHFEIQQILESSPPPPPYNEKVRASKRAEEVGIELYDHVWERVNNHLGTSATCFPELVNELGYCAIWTTTESC